MGKRQITKKLADVRHILKADYEDGVCLRELAFIYKASEGTIRARLLEAGTKLRGKGRQKGKRYN